MPYKRKKKLVTNVATGQTGATQGTQKESYGSRRRFLTRHVSSNLDLKFSPEDQRKEFNDQLNEKLRSLPDDRPDDGETVDDVMLNARFRAHLLANASLFLVFIQAFIFQLIPR